MVLCGGLVGIPCRRMLHMLDISRCSRRGDGPIVVI